MVLRQKVDKPIFGYWEGGLKDTFDWRIEPLHRGHDSKGTYVRVGSWEANYWFHVSEGKTEKATLANAKRRLVASAKRQGRSCTFEYIEEVGR